MAYKAYVTPKYNLETYRGTSIPESELDLRLRDASRHIDSLTYSRIVGQGFSALTERGLTHTMTCSKILT